MPKYSICIPTRERHGTLKDAIASVLNQTFDDFELIVQDNMSSPETRTVVEGFADDRLRYFRSDERLPMHVNWECALNQVRGDYVIFIGDDDALMPDCLERVDPIVRHDKPEIISWTSHLYYWPDVPDEKRRNHLSLDLRSGSFWGDVYSKKTEEVVVSDRHPDRQPGTMYLDSRVLLKNWLRFDRPKLYVPTYHNLISMKLIERSRAATDGVYFFIPAPDFASLLLNLYFTEDVAFYPRALTISGHSGKSNGGTHGQEQAFENAARRFFDEANLGYQDYTPSPFEPILWSAVILGKCFELVKAAVFPDDDTLEIDWGRFLDNAAKQVHLLPEDKRQVCRDWVLRSAERIGVNPDEIEFPDPPGWKRTKGMKNDGDGRALYIYIDGDDLGLKSISDAIKVANQAVPESDFPIKSVSPKEYVRQLKSQIVEQKDSMSKKLERQKSINSSLKKSLEAKESRLEKLDEKIRSQKKQLLDRKEKAKSSAEGKSRAPASGFLRRAVRKFS